MNVHTYAVQVSQVLHQYWFSWFFGHCRIYEFAYYYNLFNNYWLPTQGLILHRPIRMIITMLWSVHGAVRRAYRPMDQRRGPWNKRIQNDWRLFKCDRRGE